ncbi:MAG: hypothetical protein DHS20C19_16840 [Acidimicrobiales bacterium]|nr:MAG: hypothetical protein DHS20C19_16840 [Acidimicrobiales bacterium]
MRDFRSTRLLVGVMAAGALLVGCGDDTIDAALEVEPATVEFRALLEPWHEDLGVDPVLGDALPAGGIESAYAHFADRWTISLTLHAGSPGIDDFNGLAGDCFALTPRCPVGLIAIVVDGTVVSAPTVNAPTFDRDQITISGSFTEDEANALAASIRAGANG